jgi:hypothetical protein
MIQRSGSNTSSAPIGQPSVSGFSPRPIAATAARISGSILRASPVPAVLKSWHGGVPTSPVASGTSFGP